MEPPSRSIGIANGSVQRMTGFEIDCNIITLIIYDQETLVLSDELAEASALRQINPQHLNLNMQIVQDTGMRLEAKSGGEPIFHLWCRHKGVVPPYFLHIASSKIQHDDPIFHHIRFMASELGTDPEHL